MLKQGIVNMNSYLSKVYFYRYLAGGPVLREGRQISRRDFIIANSGINSKNALANAVVDVTNRFSIAVTTLEQIEQIDLIQLGKINHSLRGALSGPIFRTKPLVFKALRAMNNYQCPAPELAIEQSKQLLKQLGATRPTTEDSLAIMAGLTLSHPFIEGNGRTSRAIFEALCNRYNPSQLSPYLFVLSNNRMDDFIGLLHSHRDCAYTDIGQRFLSDFLVWQTDFIYTCSKLINDSVNKINSKMYFLQPNSWFQKILQVFWQNPVISVTTLPSKIVNYIAAKPALDALLERNVLTITSINNELCFIAEEILDAHEKIEAALIPLQN